MLRLSETEGERMIMEGRHYGSYESYLDEVRKIVHNQAQTGIETREKAYRRAQALLAGRQIDPLDRVAAEIELARFLAAG